MDEDMMGMDVAPVMMPDQQMMQGTPAAPTLPNELQQQINSLSEQEKAEAKEALMQIMKIVEQMLAEGATEEQVEQFLQQIGMTLEELEMAEEMFGMGEGALGFTI
jgi:hypothetical protein